VDQRGGRDARARRRQPDALRPHDRDLPRRAVQDDRQQAGRSREAGETPLDAATIVDIDPEISLSGEGAANVSLLAIAPSILADGVTVRFYLDGAFGPGAVTVTIIPGSAADKDGNAVIGSAETFTVIDRLEQADPAAPPPDRVFFIDLSGGLELNGAGLFDEPILEIRGKATIEIGERTLPDGTKRNRMTLEASGTIKVIKIGNIASGAASFVLETGDSIEDVEFWGVAAFATNLDVLKPYGITLAGSARLQINLTDRPQRETLTLEGIPGGVMFGIDLAAHAALLAAMPTDTFSKVALPQLFADLLANPPPDLDLDGIPAGDTDQTLVLDTGQRLKLEGFAPIDPEGATIEGIIAGKQWRIRLADGRQLFVERTVLDGGDQILTVRGERRTYDLPPLSFELEVAGVAKLEVGPVGSRVTVFEISGGVLISFSPTRFEIFLTGGGVLPQLLPGVQIRATGLFIVSTDGQDDDPTTPADPNAIPGVAGMLKIEVDGGLGDLLGIPSLNDILSISGEISLVFNTTRADQVFEVPEAIAAVLPADYPRLITIFEQRPLADGTARDTDPLYAGGEIYFTARVKAQIRLLGLVTLNGFVSISAGTGGGGTRTIKGAVSAEIQYLGSLAGTIDMTVIPDYDPDDSRSLPNPGVIGRVTLALQAGGGIPGVDIQGSFLLEVNAFVVGDGPSTINTFLTTGEADNPRHPPVRRHQPQPAAARARSDDAQFIFGNATIQKGLLIRMQGALVVGPLEIRGAFEFQITPDSLQVSVAASVEVGPLGRVAIGGFLRVDGEGLVLQATAAVQADFGRTFGLELVVTATFELNTSGRARTVSVLQANGTREDITVGSASSCALSGQVTFIDLVEADGSLTITLQSGVFALEFALTLTFGPITLDARGGAAIYSAPDANPGLALALAVTVAFEMAEGAISFEASGCSS
jgi:hypothetical protein